MSSSNSSSRAAAAAVEQPTQYERCVQAAAVWLDRVLRGVERASKICSIEKFGPRIP